MWSFQCAITFHKFLAPEKLHILYMGLTYSYTFFAWKTTIQDTVLRNFQVTTPTLWCLKYLRLIWLMVSWIIFNKSVMFCYVNTGWKQAVKDKLSVWKVWPQTQCTAIAKPLHENSKMTLAGESSLYQIKVFTVTAELRKGKIHKSSQSWRQQERETVGYNVFISKWL